MLLEIVVHQRYHGLRGGRIRCHAGGESGGIDPESDGFAPLEGIIIVRLKGELPLRLARGELHDGRAGGNVPGFARTRVDRDPPVVLRHARATPPVNGDCDGAGLRRHQVQRHRDGRCGPALDQRVGRRTEGHRRAVAVARISWTLLVCPPKLVWTVSPR